MAVRDAKTISDKSMRIIRKMQQNEITESACYEAIANQTKNEANASVLRRLSAEEKSHYMLWKEYTGVELKPQGSKVLRRKLLAKILGFTFIVKFMELGEEAAQKEYDLLAVEVPEATRIREDEDAHESKLLEMLDEERLQYVGSMVLGLNDALVELTGTLAGLTLAMANTRLIALSGLITGISATLSMASSEFLSAKAEGREDALKSCTYTGIAYLITVVLLILPYLIFSNHQYLYALAVMLGIVVAIIATFNFYISVAKGYSFKQRFGEMCAISLGVAALSFVVGIIVKQFLGVDI